MASMNFTFPTAVEMFRIQPDLEARGEEGRLGLKLFPRKTSSTINVRWWQKDNLYGLMQFRGLDGGPGKVQRRGDNAYDYQAGVYGDFQEISETELLTRCNGMAPTTPIGITDLVMEANADLIEREFNRWEANVFTLLQTGTISIPTPGPNGILTYKDSYTTQTFNSSVHWTVASTATPIQDMQAIQQLGVGHSGKFDASSTIYVNQYTANALINNQNSADLDGRRGMYGQTLNNLPAISSYFQGQNLPAVEVYDEGYQIAPLSGPETAPLTTTGITDQFQKYISNLNGVLVGKRPGGEPVGHNLVTINAYAPNMGASAVALVKDSFNGVNAPKEIPGKIQVFRLVNGGPTLEFPYAVVACTF